MKFFKITAGYTIFDHKKKRRNFGRVENRRSWQETKKIKIKFPTTCGKNEQQEDYKNNAEMDEDDLEDLWREY